jgi:purine-binding chemotaxis protein CheW
MKKGGCNKLRPSLKSGPNWTIDKFEDFEGDYMQVATNARTENVPAAQVDERAGKYLVFGLGREEFGIKVLNVREIMGIQDITAVPHTPPYLKGVINLRGKVIPVVDLRAKFGLPAVEHTQRTCIIVVQVTQDTGSVLMGIIVDGVAEVLTLMPGDIEDTPDFGNGVTTGYLLGMAKVKDRVKILLNIDEVMAAQELQTLGDLAQ